MAIALEAFQIGAGIRVVMEDRGAAIAAGEDMIEPAREIESWHAGHGGEHSEWSCNKSIRMPDPNSMLTFGRVPSGGRKTSYCGVFPVSAPCSPPPSLRPSRSWAP